MARVLVTCLGGTSAASSAATWAASTVLGLAGTAPCGAAGRQADVTDLAPAGWWFTWRVEVSEKTQLEKWCETNLVGTSRQA